MAEPGWLARRMAIVEQQVADYNRYAGGETMSER